MLGTGAMYVGLAVQSLIGAVILRAACALFNKWFGGNAVVGSQRSAEVGPADSQISPQDIPVAAISDSPYAPPQTAIGHISKTDKLYPRGVPAPNFGKAFLICFFVAVLQGVIGFIGAITFTSLAAEGNGFAESTFVVFQIVTMLISLMILALAIKVSLPTTVPRAFAVTGLFILVSLLVALLIGGIVFVISLLLAMA